MYEDAMLPAGRLREPVMGLRRADMILITKCPHDIQPIDLRIISHEINSLAFQQLYFTSFGYKALKAVFENESKELHLDYLRNKEILLVTGIASPKMILKELAKYTNKVESITYPDHYDFKERDIKQIIAKFEAINTDDKIILVTEKDASRLVLFNNQIDEQIKKNFYYLSIEVMFIDGEEEKFNQNILKHVRENTTNRQFYKR